MIRMNMVRKGAKRSLAIAASLLTVCAVVAGCGSSSDSNGPPAGSDTPSASTETTMTVGVQLSYPPFQFEENGKVTGFEVELVEEVLGRLGHKVEWKNTPFDTLFTAVASHKMDMAASTINGWAPKDSLVYDVLVKRIQIVALTRPIYMVDYLLVSNKVKNPDLKSADQLTDGMTVAVVQGSSEYEYAQKELAPRGVKVVTVTGGAQALTLVDSGNADATFAEGGAVAAATAAQKNLQAGDPIVSLQAGYGWALPKDEPELMTQINETIGAVMADGTYAKIFEKYFPDRPVQTDLPDASFTG